MLKGIGRLVMCIEEMEIEQEVTNELSQYIHFEKDILYTALLEEKIAVVDRTHKAIVIPQELFLKHFKLQ